MGHNRRPESKLLISLSESRTMSDQNLADRHSPSLEYGRGSGPHPRLKHSRLAVGCFCLGVLASLGWMSLPIIEKTMSLGEPFGSAFFVIATVGFSALATVLSIAIGVICLLQRAVPRKRSLAIVGILLSVGFPLSLWIFLIVW
jgi:hypothetical protein